jgi:hypothetical protein
MCDCNATGHWEFVDDRGEYFKHNLFIDIRLYVQKIIIKILNPLISIAHRILSSTTLRLSGSIYSTIFKTSAAIESIIAYQSFEVILEIIANTPGENRSGQSKIEQLWRTLVGDSFDTLETYVHPAPQELGRSFYYFVRYHMSVELFKFYGHGFNKSPAVLESFWLMHPLYEAFAQTTDLLPSRAHIASQADSIVQSCTDAGLQVGELFLPPRLPQMYDFQHNGMIAVGGRCLIVTNDGRLGLAQSSARAGDHIAFVRTQKSHS